MVIVAFGGVYAGWRTGLDRINTIEQERLTHDTAFDARISELENTLLLLARETTDLRAGVVAEVEKTTAEKEALSKALESLSTTVSLQEGKISTIVKTTDVKGIVEDWSPFVYDITCEFSDGSATVESSGSAVLQKTTEGVRFLTSKHVVETANKELESCTLVQPNSSADITVSSDAIEVSDDHDVAYGMLNENPPAMQSSQVCGTVPDIGDKVVMLGYPTIGAKESVTATEGIISGFDEDYYTTSAKIEKGNSGGAAIDVEGSCFIGLPTMVFAGKIESLARILPATSI